MIDPGEFEDVGQESSFLGHIGGLRRRLLGDRAETCLRIEPHHLNPNGTVHGGVLMTLLDITLGMTVEAYLKSQGGRHPITVQLNCNLIAAASEGQLVVGHAQVDGSSRTMTWASGRLVCEGQTLTTGTAVFRNPPLTVAGA
jgi:acyl-CoA thioesterase